MLFRSHGVLKQTRRPLFTTACYLVADVGRAQLRYANAGHPSPLHVSRATGRVAPLAFAEQDAGPALALMPDALYQTFETPLDASDLVVAFTDGVFEVPGPGGELYGEDRLQNAIRQRHALGAEALFTELLAEVRQFAANGSFSDDICLLGIETREIIRAVA